MFAISGATVDMGRHVICTTLLSCYTVIYFCFSQIYFTLHVAVILGQEYSLFIFLYIALSQIYQVHDHFIVPEELGISLGLLDMTVYK